MFDFAKARLLYPSIREQQLVELETHEFLQSSLEKRYRGSRRIDSRARSRMRTRASSGSA